jgi:hypothetical protein
MTAEPNPLGKQLFWGVVRCTCGVCIDDLSRNGAIAAVDQGEGFEAWIPEDMSLVSPRIFTSATAFN